MRPHSLVGAYFVSVLLISCLAASGQESSPTVHIVVSDDLMGFSILSKEQLGTQSYQAEHTAEGSSESLRLVAQGDEEPATIELRYRSGVLVSADAQNQQEPVLHFDFARNPAAAQWMPAQSRELPSQEEIARRSGLLREISATLRERFGLKDYRGREGDIAQLLVTGRDLISIYFRTLGPQGGTYTLIDPIRDDMVEVVTDDEYLYSWTISVAKKQVLIEKYYGAGLTTMKSSLIWDAGRWHGEILEIQPQYKKATQVQLSSAQARLLLQEGGELLGSVRQRFKTERFTLSLAEFGLP